MEGFPLLVIWWSLPVPTKNNKKCWEELKNMFQSNEELTGQ